MRRMFSEKQIKELIQNIDGNVKINGNLVVEGYIQASEYEFDEDIEVSSLPSGMNCYYAHARVSNGKLNIVIALNSGSTSIGSLNTGTIASLVLPANVYDKLYPVGTLASTIAFKTEYLCNSNAITDLRSVIQILKDGSNTLKIVMTQDAGTVASINMIARFELNFLLS